MDGPQLGKLIDGEAFRDAVHVAVLPVTALGNFAPGTHVGLSAINGVPQRDDTGYYQATTNADPIGIIDPFLKEPVRRLQWCWLLLYPGTITSLRHVWVHPAFKAKAPEVPS